jgi:hypothetical protein
MKKIYLLGFASMIALGVNAQTTLTVKNPLKQKNAAQVGVAKTRNASNAVARNIGGPMSAQAMTGILNCQTQYVPGTTMDLVFELELTNTDAEYGDKLDITFPANFTINSTLNTPDLGPDDGEASSDGPEAFVGITGQTITWGNDDNYYGGIVPSYDPNGPGTYVITINVTIGAMVTGMQTATFAVSGDGFGANPADLTGGVCAMFEQGMTIIDGAVSDGGPQTASTCGNTLVPIGIRIKNYGNDSIMNFPVSYQIDALTAVNEVVTDTILPGDSLDFIFSVPADFTAEADYVVKMWTSVSGELVPANDTIAVDFQNSVPVNLSTTPYVNTFEGTGNEYFALYIGANAGSTVNWALVTNSAPNSHGGVRHLNLQAAAAIGDAWVMFKCMNVTMGEQYDLTYWTKTSAGANGGTSVNINLTGQTAADMNAGVEIKPFTANTANNVYQQISVPLVAPASGTIYVGIRGAGTAAGAGTSVRLDDINITMSPVGIKDNAATAVVGVFPNPNAGVFTVSAVENNSSVEVYSVLGENVFSSKLVKGYNTVDLSTVAAGTYVVKVKSATATTTKRIVINK